MEDNLDSMGQTKTQKHSKPLLLWPGVVIVLLQWLIRYVIPIFYPDAMIVGVFGGLIGGLCIIIWWAFFSRAPRVERWSGILLIIIALVITSQLIHESIATGAQGMMFALFSIPIVSLAFVIWAVVSRNFSKKQRLLTMILTIVLATGSWILLRVDGITGDFHLDLNWRWATTTEEKLLAQDENISKSFVETKEMNYSWPGFRGSKRDGIVHGTNIETDWKKSPPKEMWRRPIGPGCSSFAVKGSLVFTQEQRGEDEVVSCYNLETGEPLWMHQDKARFWDSHAGAGPRSTPTLDDSLVYTLGATGILNALKANNGDVLWSRNAAVEINDSIPGWGYAGSPLVVDSILVVSISGTLRAFNKITGKPLWTGPKGGENYSSPHLVTINKDSQVLLMSQFGTTSFNPVNGNILWEWPWKVGAIVQPAITENGDILIGEGNKMGLHRISVSNVSGKWDVTEQWKTTKIRPDFNDMVVHKGYLYGFDGLSLTCIDLKDGNRRWKAGRYGGQVIFLADQDLLIVLSEKGELVLVHAVPDKFEELAKIQAIKGKTWNHHVLVGNILLVRNTEEMAAFKLQTL